jgi:hypothetical protein
MTLDRTNIYLSDPWYIQKVELVTRRGDGLSLTNRPAPNIQANACRIACTTSIDHPLDAKKNVDTFMKRPAK